MEIHVAAWKWEGGPFRRTGVGSRWGGSYLWMPWRVLLAMSTMPPVGRATTPTRPFPMPLKKPAAPSFMAPGRDRHDTSPVHTQWWHLYGSPLLATKSHYAKRTGGPRHNKPAPPPLLPLPHLLNIAKSHQDMQFKHLQGMSYSRRG